MAYNEDDLNPVKGRIGELLFANYLYKTNKIVCIDPDLQKRGIDWRIDLGLFPLDVDVKFSDKLEDFFAVTYRNSYNVRMPFHKNCEATWLAIVTFDWSSYVKDSTNGKDELPLALKTRDDLAREFEEKEKFPLTEFLINKYVSSIVSVKVQRVVSLCEGFEKKLSGESNTDEQGNIVATKVGTDVYAAAHIKWAAIPPTSKVVHFENQKLQQHISTKPFYLTYKWPFNPNKVIAIDEYGKTLEEMESKSLEWIKAENIHPKSTFYRKFQVSKEEFSAILEEILGKKSKSIDL